MPSQIKQCNAKTNHTVPLFEKKAKQFDQVVGEWKYKVDHLALELDAAQKDTRKPIYEMP